MTAGPAVQRLLDRLDAVRPAGPDKWIARCPCHDDKKPSLRIAQGDTGALVFCDPCSAKGGDVCDALGLLSAALFDDYDESKPRRRKEQTPKPPTIGDALADAADAGPETLDAALRYVCDAAMESGGIPAGGNGAGAAEMPESEAEAAVRAWLAAEQDERTDVRLLIPMLAQLDPLTYDGLRGDVAKSASVRAVTLDGKVQDARQDGAAESDGHQGAALALADVEPWPDPVDGAELLTALVRTIARFVALPDGAATAMALWIVFAHAHDAAAVSPLLALNSPEKRCGKTTALSVLSALVPRALPAANISAAALFRAVEKYTPTLLVDEADTFLQDRDELRGVLNAGHTRATAYAVRCDGEDHDARLFSTWAPKVIAMIGRLPDTLEDRSVLVSMRRRAPGENIERLRLDRLAELKPQRRMAARWAADNLEPLTVADPEVPAGLHDRAADNWRPLLAIADRAGGDWPERARKAAALLSGASGDDDGSVRTLLLADLRAVFGNAERMASADVVAALVDMEDRPWPEWRRGEPLTPRGLARLLGPFDVRPRQLWIDGAKTRGYERDDFTDTWARYLTADDAPPRTESPRASGRSGRSPASTGVPANHETVGGGSPTASEIGATPRQQGILPDLPDGAPIPDRFAGMDWREQQAARLREIRERGEGEL